MTAPEASVIRTERLVIRRIRTEDRCSVQAIWSSLAGTEYARYNRPKPLDEASVQTRVEEWAACSANREHRYLAVCLGENMIGYLLLHLREKGYELGYSFHPLYHGKGYAFESISALLASLREEGISQVFAGTGLKNLPSVRLLERLGFVCTATEQVSFYRDSRGAPVVFEGGVFRKDLRR